MINLDDYIEKNGINKVIYNLLSERCCLTDRSEALFIAILESAEKLYNYILEKKHPENCILDILSAGSLIFTEEKNKISENKDFNNICINNKLQYKYDDLVLCVAITYLQLYNKSNLTEWQKRFIKDLSSYDLKLKNYEHLDYNLKLFNQEVSKIDSNPLKYYKSYSELVRNGDIEYIFNYTNDLKDFLMEDSGINTEIYSFIKKAQKENIVLNFLNPLSIFNGAYTICSILENDENSYKKINYLEDFALEIATDEIKQKWDNGIQNISFNESKDVIRDCATLILDAVYILLWLQIPSNKNIDIVLIELESIIDEFVYKCSVIGSSQDRCTNRYKTNFTKGTTIFSNNIKEGNENNTIICDDRLKLSANEWCELFAERLKLISHDLVGENKVFRTKDSIKYFLADITGLKPSTFQKALFVGSHKQEVKDKIENLINKWNKQAEENS